MALVSIRWYNAQPALALVARLNHVVGVKHGASTHDDADPDAADDVWRQLFCKHNDLKLEVHLRRTFTMIVSW